MKSIFTRPLFINPLAYLTIPELSCIQTATPFDFTEDSYSFKVNTTGRIEGKLLKAKDDCILHLDLYSIDGNCVLGEFYLNNSQIDLNSFNLLQNGNIITINFSSIPSPIASYRAYDKTNDDTDRDVLKDLTGNGHDIQLYNFAWSGMSGIGGYGIDASEIKSANNNLYNVLNNGNEITVSCKDENLNLKTGVAFAYYKKSLLSEKLTLYAGAYGLGIVEIDVSGEYIILFRINPNETATFHSSLIQNENSTYIYFIFTEDMPAGHSDTFGILPEYPNALVSDGVDDYGLCENFPILEVEKGFTIIGIRKLLDSLDSPTYKYGSVYIGAGEIYSSLFGDNYNGNIAVKSFGKINTINGKYSKDICFIMNSIRYNNTKISKGTTNTSTNNLYLFCDKNKYHKGSAALYALEIYDRDLTDKEIATVKERMIAEYEEKTGNKYEEEIV